jgi:hypothetical protein
MIGIVRIEIVCSIAKEPEICSSRHVTNCPISCSSEKIDASRSAVEYSISNDRDLGLMKPYSIGIVPKTDRIYDIPDVIVRAAGKIKSNAMENFRISPFSTRILSLLLAKIPVAVLPATEQMRK